MTEQNISQARKELEKIGLVSHFAGELALVGVLGKCAYSSFANSNHLDNYISSFVTDFPWGLFAYSSLQAIAFHLQGISRTPTENLEASLSSRREETELRRKKLSISAGIVKQFAKMQEHYANNYERYLPQLNFYAKLRGLK